MTRGQHDFKNGRRGVFFERAQRGMTFVEVSDAEDQRRTRMALNKAPLEVPFEDEYGEKRILRRRVSKAGNGAAFSVKRTTVTPILALNAEVSKAIGARVRAFRLARGMTLVDLANRIGAPSGNPKQRIWQIENPGVRSTGETYGGMRLGTLYALAIALDVDVFDLMPSAADVGAASLGSHTALTVGRKSA